MSGEQALSPLSSLDVATVATKVVKKHNSQGEQQMFVLDTKAADIVIHLHSAALQLVNHDRRK